MAPPGNIDALFQLPLADFTAARNALAASLNGAGRTADAKAVKALPKPSLSAWTVNQLFWRHRPAFNRFMAAGARLRKMHASKLNGGKADLPQATAAQAAALRDLMTRATQVLHDAGRPSSATLTRRIATTLDALASGEPSSADRNGHLTDDVAPSGFEALTQLVPRRDDGSDRPGRSRVIPFRRRGGPSGGVQVGHHGRRRDGETARRKAAVNALRNAEAAVRASRKTAARAETALRTAATHVKLADKAKAVAEKRLEQATARADAARLDAHRIAVTAEEAAQAIADAERVEAQARRTLETLP